MHVQNKKYENSISISSLTGKCAAQFFFTVLVYVHIIYGHIKKPFVFMITRHGRGIVWCRIQHLDHMAVVDQCGMLDLFKTKTNPAVFIGIRSLTLGVA